MPWSASGPIATRTCCPTRSSGRRGSSRVATRRRRSGSPRPRARSGSASAGTSRPTSATGCDGSGAGCEAALGPDAERVWAEGSRLGVNDAIGLAFGTSRPRPAAPAGLSARELEVVRLITDGLANKAIAAQLHVSVRTVESHVRHALAKAGRSNRTQLAGWARDHLA
jgi:non-specific serine/threonine protein kinase